MAQEPERARVGVTQAVLASVAVHAIFVWFTPTIIGALISWGWVTPLAFESEASALTEIEIAEPEPLPEEPEPLPEPAVAPEPQTPVIRRDRAVPERAVTEEPVSEPPPQTEEAAPIDLSGTTLTGQSGGFAVNPGTGEDRQGPISAPSRPTGNRSTVGGNGQAEVGRPAMPSDLSERPQPPAEAVARLRNCIQRRYPERARAQSIEGTVRGQMVVELNGRLSSIRVRTEEPEGWGFAAACRACLEEQTDWRPGRATNGDATRAYNNMYCAFSVDD